MERKVRQSDTGTYGSLQGVAEEHNARNAFKTQNKDDSKQIHDEKTLEIHRIDGDFIKSIVYGGLDGILSTFAIISGASGGNLTTHTIVILGLSNLFANAVGMGVGDVISTKSYQEHVENERNRELWEFENFKEGEIDEMVDLYEEKGLPRFKAEIVIETMSKYKDLFIDVMVAEELGLTIPDQDEDPYKEGFVTFLSFILFGGLPLMFYSIMSYFVMSPNVLFISSFFVTAAVLFLLGVCKSYFSSTSWKQSGTEFLLLGSLCAFVSYFIGYFVAALGNV